MAQKGTSLIKQYQANIEDSKKFQLYNQLFVWFFDSLDSMTPSLVYFSNRKGGGRQWPLKEGKVVGLSNTKKIGPN